MIQLGSYILNVQEMILSHEGKDIVLEPKVCEVLVYLCENKDNYLSMNELHENIWADRCVSDAAVRRTISKLRQIFGDDHKDPKYIQSLPRRGYKLICPVSTVQDPTKSNQITPISTLKQADTVKSESLAAPSYVQIADDNLPVAAKNRKKPRLLGAIFMLLVMIIAKIAFDLNPDLSFTQVKKTLSMTAIKSLPGDKRAIAQSIDGRYMAFIAQMTEQSGFQIYIKKQQKHDFEPVTHDAHLPFALDFSASGNSLFYSDMETGASSLNKIDMTDNNYKKSVLLKGFHIITDVFTGKSPDHVYFSGQKDINKPRFIYRYNLNTQKTDQITSSSQKLYRDMKGAMSPDENSMAILRFIEFEKRYEVRVIDLTNNNILYRHQQDNKIFDLQWLNNDQLLMLDKSQLISIQPKTKTKSHLINQKHQLTAITVIDQQTLLALEKPPVKSIFIERNLPLDTWSTAQLFNNKADAIYMAYHKDNKERLVIYHNGKATTLAKISNSTNEISPLIETMYSLKFQASATSGPLELIKINHRITLLNTLSSELTYITHGDDFVGDAAFSLDEQAILYSIKNYDEWQVHSYDINTATVSAFLSGYRYIRPYNENFIVGTDEGELSWYNTLTTQNIPLNIKLSNESNTHWDVKADNIYWSSHDAVKTVFHQLDISDLHQPLKYQKSFDFNKVRPQFSINKDNSSLLHGQRQQKDTNVLKILINT